MTIQNIITINNKEHKLEVPAQLITEKEFASTWLYKVADDLRDTMNASKATGIAASQIGIYKQIIAFGGKPSLNFPDFNVPFTILINPTYAPLNDDKVTVWEHCLSLPKKRGRTVRYARIIYNGRDITGKKITGEASGILAVLLQHEIDHTQGKLFPHAVLDKAEYADIAHFEKTKGVDHHIKDGLQLLNKSDTKK